ncbi:uncharacterized protein [Miscanthus floridulus]|uniref:uncharacterized protein n=1 Tax=Miscanthus floridulus TaxID=154761 RepID=UPI00345B20B0
MAGTGGHGGHATTTTTTVVEDEGCSVEAVVSPFKKHQVEAPTLAPRKALKVSTSSTAQWVVEVQAAIQRGMASARVDPKEPVAQGDVTEVATKRAGEEAPTSHEAEARESDEAEAPSVAETTEAEMVEAGAPRTSEAEVADAGAPRTTEAKMVEAGGPETAEAEDQLRHQKDLLTGANELLLAWSVEVEDLCLRCADMKAEAATAWEQAAPLVARIKELEELTQVAKLEKEASRAAEASRVEVQSWKEKAEGLEKEISRAAEASVEVQAVLEAKIQEHNALQSAACIAYKALEVGGSNWAAPSGAA